MRHRRVRSKIQGTSERPRLSVFRSNRYLWLQLIDDTQGKTLASVSEYELFKGKKKMLKAEERGEALGVLLAKKAKDMHVKTIVFDRGGYRYHGMVKAVAEGARKDGLTL